jgi:hypothetical protein
MKNRFCAFLIILFSFSLLLSLLLSFFFGKDISVIDSLAIIEKMTTVSSILLGIMGVWLSIIWTKDNSDKSKEIHYIKNTFIICFINISVFLILNQLYPILIHCEVLYQSKILLRSGMFFISNVLTFWIVVSLLFVVLSFDFFSFDDFVKLQINEVKKDKNNRLFSLTTKHEDE